ncbi:MAG: hypothetical protein IPJ88_15810 [Myxococcales bacterium]|nr:MAG: hypothetical protein IPJ88_15810 [Myxococcales bacterium]
MLRILQDASYAHAEIEGSVKIDTRKLTATVKVVIYPGPACRFGKVDVVVDDRYDLPKSTILGAAKIHKRSAFSLTALEEARREVYALGAFSSVEIEPELNEKNAIIDVHIHVTPGRLFRYGLGVGMLSGIAQLSSVQEQQDVLQWDLHVLGFVEFRNLLGGLRRLRIEERPRLIFTRNFPQASDGDPVLGNLVTVEFQQPGFVETRTTLTSGARWDFGPQPYGEDYSRHNLDAWVGPQRYFAKGHLFASTRIHGNVFFPTHIGASVEDPPKKYEVLFFEQYARLDLRDRPRQPHKGSFFALGLHEAIPPGSWTYLRFTPDARVYLPLPLGFTLAGRFAMGIMEILESSFNPATDPRLATLGPGVCRCRRCLAIQAISF